MKRFSIVVPKTYQKNGEEKTSWNRVGNLVYFPATQEKSEGYILELHMFPNTKFAVFEDKPKEAQQAPKEDVPTINTEEQNPEDIF